MPCSVFILGGSLYSVWHVCIDMIDYCHNVHEMLSMFLAQVLFVVVVQNKHTKIAIQPFVIQNVSYIDGKLTVGWLSEHWIETRAAHSSGIQ